ncbi:MAG TPA: serine/threonine-protein kinase [Polyangiaceae bacterium]|nr:serine/threonine-protein kinase [Polyangiaceae bacterium]
MSDLLRPGQIFAGRYRIDRFLAKGGFGAVYVAEQIETELSVALKVLWPHVLYSQDTVEKFKLEARIAGRVGSEHIVRVLDAGFDEAAQMPFLAMELLVGDNLESLVGSSGPLSPNEVVTYFRQIASALDKAHGYVDKDGSARPIVHRDLKPENLFLFRREAGDPIIKILDFGIAKVLSDSTKMSQDVKGTPLYMAFEQAASGRITGQTDIWPLGLIAFFLLTGRCYWRSANAAEASLTQLFGEVLSLPIEPPTRRAAELGANGAIPPAFDAWFDRCVNRDATRRFSTAGECAATLANVLLGVPMPQATGSASGPRQSPFASASSPVVAVATSAPGIGNTDQSLSLAQTKSAPSGARRFSLGLLASLVVVSAAVGVTLFAVRRAPSDAKSAASASGSSAPTPAEARSSIPLAPGSVIGSAPTSAQPSASASASASANGATSLPPASSAGPKPQKDVTVKQSKPPAALKGPTPPPPVVERGPAPPPLVPR